MIILFLGNQLFSPSPPQYLAACSRMHPEVLCSCRTPPSILVSIRWETEICKPKSQMEARDRSPGSWPWVSHPEAEDNAVIQNSKFPFTVICHVNYYRQISPSSQSSRSKRKSLALQNIKLCFHLSAGHHSEISFDHGGKKKKGRQFESLLLMGVVISLLKWREKESLSSH